MIKNSLVFSKKDIQLSTTSFKCNVPYRCMTLNSVNETQYLVYGVAMDKEYFDDNFVLAYDVIINELTELGVIQNGKLVSKTKFKTLLDFHYYGSGKRKNIISYLGQPKKLMYQFHNQFTGDNKTTCINYYYNNIKNILLGNMDCIDENDINRGNSGIPLSSRNIYFR